MEHEGFLQAIREAPDDDAPRLVYADWLDDHGDPDRAEFIRLQCAYAKTALGGPQWRGLSDRLWELWRRHHEEWCQPLVRLGLEGTYPANYLSCNPYTASHYGFPDWLLPRGFLDEVDMTAERFLKLADALFHEAPIQKAYLSEAREHVVALAQLPYLARLTTLRLSGRVTESDPGEMSGRMAEVTYWDGVTAAGAQALAASPHLGRLTSLDLAHNEIGDAGAQALAASPHLARLTTLELGDNAITYAGARALAASPHLARLARLNLSGNAISHQGARALARSPHVARLSVLNLEWQRRRPGGHEAP
jgi:uncharacterized protein (TIGR02996 family)